MIVIHLMTQDNQPYGSERRCCELCGIMIWCGERPAFIDDRAEFDALVVSVNQVKCDGSFR